jgi:hypothetical protein
MFSPALLQPALIASMVVLSPTAAAQPKLWIVSRSGCPLVHFAEIQPAVDAAADGDVILVRPGAGYAAFTVDAKSIAVCFEGIGGGFVAGSVTVRNLRANQSVLLHGFQRSGGCPPCSRGAPSMPRWFSVRSRTA